MKNPSSEIPMKRTFFAKVNFKINLPLSKQVFETSISFKITWNINPHSPTYPIKHGESFLYVESMALFLYQV